MSQADISCPPFDVTSMLLNTDVRTDGTSVVVSCTEGFTLEGAGDITCLQGAWSPGVPRCKATEAPINVMAVVIPIVAGVACVCIIGLAIYMFCRRNAPQKKGKKQLEQQKQQKMQSALWTISQYDGVTQDVVGMPAMKHTSMDQTLRGRPDSVLSEREELPDVTPHDADLPPLRDFSY